MSKQIELSVTKQTKIKKLLKTLISNVQNSQFSGNNIGLLSGSAGELLFLWQASQYDVELVNESKFNKKLELLQENVFNVASDHSLSAGLSGLGWFLEYINQAQGEDYDPELCEDIDDILLNALSVSSWQGEIEMVLGLAGLSIYGSRRQLKSDQGSYYEKLISHFEHLAIQISDNILTWQQPFNSVYRLDKEDSEKLEFNLGLAHGVPGIIAAILPALSVPSLFNRAKKLLIQSCDWLMLQQLNIRNKQSYFSSLTDSTYHSRLGWCYGDLTIALTLFRVGKALELPSYMDKAKEIGLHSARRGEVDAVVRDAGICHGSAGLFLIFNLLYKEIGSEELRLSADKWLDFTLSLYDEKGIEGLYKMSGLDNTYSECVGFLEGYAGIGLCLLAAFNEDTDWTDSLLLS